VVTPQVKQMEVEHRQPYLSTSGKPIEMRLIVFAGRLGTKMFDSRCATEILYRQSMDMAILKMD